MRECSLLRATGPNRHPVGPPVYTGTVILEGGGHDAEPITAIYFRAAPGQPDAAPGEFAQVMPATGRTTEGAWADDSQARSKAAQRQGAWEIPRGPVLATPDAFKAPVEKILACWAQGAADPTAMWHCSGMFVGHGDFAACMTGAWCVPPTSVPPAIRATGLPLAPYVTAATEPVEHLAVARANAARCLSAGLQQEAFAGCFLQKEMPIPDVIAMTCASARRTVGLVPDAEWMKMCVSSAAGLNLRLPPAVQACVASGGIASAALAGCLNTLDLGTQECRRLAEGGQDAWLACLYEQAALQVQPGDKLKCMLQQAKEDKPDPMLCFLSGGQVPMEAVVELALCTQDGSTSPQACFSRALLGADATRDCTGETAQDLVRCAATASGNAQAVAVVDCMQRAEGERVSCLAELGGTDPAVVRAIRACTDTSAGTVQASCVTDHLFADAPPAARCLGASDVSDCLAQALLGSNGRTVIRCALVRDPDGIQACLDAAGITVPEEFDAAWACRNALGTEEALHCLAKNFLGDDERLVLECAEKAASPEEAALCIASPRLGERERALLECMQANDDADARLVCAVGVGVLKPEDRRTLACAMRGGLVDFVLCQNSSGLTPEQQAALTCATQSADPLSFAACMGAKLTLIELTKCVFLGVGTEGGCFSETNDLRRAVQTAFHDLTQGPGANNDLIRLSSQLEDSLAALGGPVGTVLGDVLHHVGGLPVLVGPTLMTMGQAGRNLVEQAGDFLGNICDCEISFSL